MPAMKAVLTIYPEIPDVGKLEDRSKFSIKPNIPGNLDA
jgi:hypothetical protein